MPADRAHNPHTLLYRLVPWAALLAIVVGCLVLVGWTLDIAGLKSILPGWVSMKVNTAICFILIGTSLWLITRQRASLALKPSILLFGIARILLLLSGLISVLTLSEYLFGWNLGIDQWLIGEANGTVGTSHAGRMAPETALDFLLLSVALWINSGSRKARWQILVAVSIGMMVAILALASLLSYLTPSIGAYGWFGLTIMAVHTAILFTLLGMAVITISWQTELIAWALGSRVTVALACGITVLVFIGLNTSRIQFWMKDTNFKIAYSEEVLRDTGMLLIDVIGAQAHTRGYVITGDENFKSNYMADKVSSNLKLDALRKLVSGNSFQQLKVAQIEERVNAELQWFQFVVDHARNQPTNVERNRMIVHGEDLLDDLRAKFDQFESEHRQIVEHLKQEVVSVSSFSSINIFAGAFASIVIFLAVISQLNSAVAHRRRMDLIMERNLSKLSEMGKMAKVGSWELDLTNMKQTWSDEVYRIHEVNLENKADAGKGLNFYTPAAKLSIERVLLRVMENSRLFSEEFEIISAKGNRRWIHLIGKIYQENGINKIASGTIQDITERKKADSELAEREQRFHAVTQSANDAIISASSTGKIVDWNPAAEKMFGYEKAEILGQSLIRLIPERFHDMEEDGLTRLVEGGAGYYIGKTIEIIGLRKHGGEFPLELSLSQWQAADGQFFTGIVRDITERKRHEARTVDLLKLTTSAESLDEKSLLKEGLDRMQLMTDSRIGFLHFVSEDQNEIELITWSSDTLDHYCKAVYDRHYPVSAAGIWADCISQKQAVVVNNYATETNKKGLPEGHAGLQRFISVPIFEGELVRMIVGVGNADRDYDENDVETIKLFSYDIYHITQRKRTEEVLKKNTQRLLEMGQIAKVGAWELDVATMKQSWSDEMYHLYEVDKDYEPNLSTWTDFYEPESRLIIEQVFQRAIDQGEPFSEELKFISAKGTRRCVHIIGKATRQDGKTSAVSGAFQDVTKRKMAERKLVESEEHFRAVAQSANDAIITGKGKGEGEGNIVGWNLAAEKLFGYSEAEIIGQSLTRLMPERFRMQHNAGLSRVANGGVTHMIGTTAEAVGLRKNGEEFPLELSLSQWQAFDGQFFTAIIRDISARIQAQEALAQLNAELEEKVMARTADLEHARLEADQANRAKSAFLATMSHEIRTPMNGVIGMVDVLRQSSLRSSQIEMADVIRDSAFALLTIVDDILDFSKIEAGKFQIDTVPMNVAEVVVGVCETLSRVAHNKNVELLLFTDPEIPEMVWGDAVRLRQVLINLLGNAIKFSSKVEVQGKVSLRALVVARTEERVSLEIRILDNGIGISEEAMARLFTAFTQADSSTTRSFGGTGLGLAISHQLVSMMGGEIRVKSELGKGSLFTVHISFMQISAEKNVSAVGGQVSINQARLKTVSVAGMLCLLVGDGQSLADDFATYLRHDGAQVVRVNDLEAAQQWIAKQWDGMQFPAQCVTVIDTAGATLQMDELRATALSQPGLDQRIVLVGRGNRRQGRIEKDGCIALDAEVMHRYRFIEAVAIAAGRVQAYEAERIMQEDKLVIVPLSREEARQQGSLILIAEDNDINQKVIQKQLNLLGKTADIASDGSEALKRWQSGDYSILITDLHMPKMDGYELTKAIRAAEAGKVHKPIIAFTANALKGEAENCLEIGMDDYLSKPVQLDNLKAMLDKWMNTVTPVSVVHTAEPTQVSSQGGGNETVDVNVLKVLVGDEDEVIRDFLRDFSLSAEKIAAELHVACEAGQMAQAGALAHKLKSSARSVGALVLGDICAEMELTGKGGDKAKLTSLLSEFEQEYAKVTAFLAAY